ncbi:hypothetical protein [Pseudomonas sp. Q1]|uniref:hypothetical protein n=1 Tax=Pseudomonas sp. Q1 TaxID=2202823 RepID=UPI001374F107|nr:hypothetical protein [Pseudomonas sp. Q1]NCE83512.1 hypothetical protein [Pseudomonas sp. Q1]
MTDNTELKRAASASKNWGGEVGEGRWYAAECFKRPYFSAQDAEFIAACDPGRVLALIAENERLNTECKQLILLEHHGGTVEAATNLLAERDQLKAENEALRKDADKWQIVERAMTQLQSDEQGAAIWSACSRILISVASELNSGRSVVTEEGVTNGGVEIGDWRVTVERIDAAMGKGEQS